MNKRTNLIASLAIAIATIIATSHATYAQSPLPIVDITVGLEDDNQSVYERDGVAVIAIEITAGADTLPNNVGVGFNLQLSSFNAYDQYNKQEGQYYDYEAPHTDGGQYYVTIEPGETRVEIRITVIDDELVEHFQRFTVRLTHDSQTFLPSGAVHEDSSLTLSPAEGQVAILDNDSAKLLMRDRHTYVNENVGEIEIVQEVREKLIEYNFTVIHLTISGIDPSDPESGKHARVSEDFHGYSEFIEFDSYETQRSSFLRIIDDDMPEGYKPIDEADPIEVMRVHLLRNQFDLDDAEITNSSAYVFIRDDDPAFYIPRETLVTDTTTIPIRLSYPVPRAVSIDYEIVGSNYHKAGTAHFAAEQTEVLITNQTDREDMERITLDNQSAGKIYNQIEDALGDRFEYDLQRENGELRLADGANADEGRLEVFHNAVWGTVCDDRLDNRRNIAPQKACQFMGYATGELIAQGSISPARASQKIWLDDVRCFAGSNHWTGAPAQKLHHCYNAGWGLHNCTHEEDVHLSCTGTLEQTETPPLTATLESMPTNHDGSSAFTFQIAFSADVEITPENMREHALIVSGATVTHATRVDARSDLWELTLEPTGSGAVSILVPLNRACTEPGALCTAQGGMLTIAPAQSIPGPAQGPQAPRGLTASFVAVPTEHDGETEFWIELTFGAAVAQGSKSEIRALLGASGGSVTKLRRKDGRLDHWRIKIQPSSHEPVTVTLSPSPPCGTTGAVCTDDGRTFTTGLATQIQGPPGISVADAQVQEAANATLAFAVTLNRAPSGTVTVDYATSDGTATAGSDYTARSGTLSFAAGESEKTVSVPVFDDGHDEGSETLTLTLSNPSGAYLADSSAIGTINNSDPMPLAWMVRFGRTVGSQVVDALGQRLDSATTSHVTIAGINLTGEPGAVPMDNDDPFGLPEWATRRRLETNGDDITTDDLLLRSAFHISNRSDDGMGAHPAFTAWGQIARSGFEAEVDDVTMDGDVTTGLIGFDAEWERVLAGVMLSQSSGEGSYQLSKENEGRTETVESALTGIYPYARIELNRQVSAWALAGMGSGDLTLHHDDHRAMPTDITMRMGAVGFKSQVLDGTGASGLAMNIKSDAMWVQTKSERTADMVATQGEVRRLRITLAGERAFAAGEGATLTPSAEVGLGHDAGDAETGTGIEMGAGLRYVAGALTVEGQVRMLVAHEDNGYEQWGASGAIRVTPNPSGRGLMLSIAPEWGRTGSTTDRLWSAHDASRLGADDEFEAEGTIAIDAGYGVGLAHRHDVITPYASLTLGDGGTRTIRTGLRWQVAPDVAFGIEGTRRVDTTNEGENEVRLQAALRF